MRRRQGAAVEGGAGIGEGSMREEGESVAAGDGLGWRRFFFCCGGIVCAFFSEEEFVALNVSMYVACLPWLHHHHVVEITVPCVIVL